MNLNSASHIEQELANLGPWVNLARLILQIVLLAHSHTIPSMRVASLYLRLACKTNQPTKAL